MIDNAHSVDDPQTYLSGTGGVYQVRDTRCQGRNGLEEDPQEHELQKKAQKKTSEYRFPRRRQIAHSICESFRETGTHESVLDSSDVMNVTLPRDDVEGLETRWDECVQFVKKKSSTIESCSCLRNEDTRARAATMERPSRTLRTGNVRDSTELRSCETATYESALSVDVRIVPENARNSSMHLARGVSWTL